LNTRSYYSTNQRSASVSFSEALLKGLAPDGGLYMPDSIPVLSREVLSEFGSMSYSDIAFRVLSELIGSEIPSDDLARLCKDAYHFSVPLEKVEGRKNILRLDQGPTASFKDFAARMMSRLMQYFLAASGRQLTILTATSGDTGSAVASAFYGLDNINVIILYPADEVTAMQRKQMTTLDRNISIISIDGKFDDCQRLVKQAFTDPSLSGVPLSSANSINIGRLLPQSVYYFYAWSKLALNSLDKAVFSVPSGNFGNLMGGLIAKRMGLPVEKFVIATNANDEVPEFLRTGVYSSISPSLNCISSAMNVGHPSNLARMVELYGGSMDEKGTLLRMPDLVSMRSDLFGISVTDEETKEVISDMIRKYNILLEPHGAVAWKGLSQYLKSVDEKSKEKVLSISLETAHPAKFPEELMKISGKEPPLPDSLAGLEGKKESYTELGNSYEQLREFILKHN
jgi:threonine synthase